MTIKYVRHPDLTREDDIWCDIKAEEYFHTSEDPNQARLEDCSFEISKKFPYTWTVIKDGDKLIGYTYILPATNKIMRKFAKGQLTENQLVKIINKKIKYSNCDAAYLAGAVVIEEYQNKGYAIKATIDTLLNMDKERGMKLKDLYIWPFTDAMNSMIDKAKRLAEKDGRTLHVYTD
jgi:hypothetical protein